MKKADLLSMNEEELAVFCEACGEKRFRGAQLFRWLHAGADFSEMLNLPAAFRQTLAERAEILIPQTEKKFISALDGTAKYLFRLSDGECVESVLMRYRYGLTACLSTQAGCRMGCAFCASTLGGKTRDLSPSEILGQLLKMQKDSEERISHIVLMGIGEPLDNYENVIRFLRLVNAENGLHIGYRQISLSTCGLADQIRRLADEGLPVTLSVSLHAATDKLRSEIMPVNRKWNISTLLGACLYYFEKTGRRISFEYTLIPYKNDSAADTETLADTLNRYVGRRMPLHINLIPLNGVAETVFPAGDRKRATAFAAVLERRGLTATVRRRLGSDINASCGQLRHAARQTGINALKADAEKGG